MKKYTLLLLLLFNTILIFAQSITSIDPATGSPLEPLTVTISGENTHFNQATNTAVWFSQGSLTVEYPSSINIINDTEVEANITFGANYDTPEVYDVNVYNEIDGMVSFPLSFTLQTLPTPLIVSVSPEESNILETLTVTISGENTHFNQATTTAVWFSQGSATISSNNINVISDNNFEAEFSFPVTSQTGFYDVNVFSEFDGIRQLYSGFYLYDMLFSPQILNIIPENISTNETVTIQITGEHTHFTQGDIIQIWFDSETKEIISAESVTIINDDRIDAIFTFPENTPFQSYNLHINSNFDGEIVLEEGFHVGPNSIQSVVDYKLIVSPNPSKDIFYINSKEIIENIKLIDINGKIINSFSVFSKQTSLNLNYLSKGVYFLQINLKGQTVTQSIIIE